MALNLECLGRAEDEMMLLFTVTSSIDINAVAVCGHGYYFLRSSDFIKGKEKLSVFVSRS